MAIYDGNSAYGAPTPALRPRKTPTYTNLTRSLAGGTGARTSFANPYDGTSTGARWQGARRPTPATGR